MSASHRTWGTALGLATALIVAYVFGWTVSALLAAEKKWLGWGPAGLGRPAAFSSTALLVLAGSNQVFGERWRVVAVTGAFLASRALSLYLAQALPWDPWGDGFGTVVPISPIYAAFLWIVPPLVVGWFTRRTDRRRRLDLALIGGATLIIILLVLF